MFFAGWWWRCLSILAAVALAVGCRPDGPGAEADQVEAEPTSLAFTDATEAAGLGDFVHETGAFGAEWFPETVGGGVALLDYDGDGWTDILLVRGARWPGQGAPVGALALYRNLGRPATLAFEEVTLAAGLADVRAYPQGLAAADVDNDGDTDFVLTTLAENLLFRNEGGRFVEVPGSGIDDHEAWSTSALFFDADADGALDLYVGNYVDWAPERDIWCTMDGTTKAYCTPQAYTGVPGRFYRGDGAGGFAEQTRAAGFTDTPGKTLGVAMFDFDADGWTDVLVANDTQRDLLYQNRGDGTFEEIGVVSGIAFDENGKARAGMGIAAGDVEGSGRPAVFVGHFSNEMIGVFQYVGDRIFVDRAAVSRIGHPSLLTLAFGLFLFDAELDGDLDLFVANGHIADDIERTQDAIAYRQPPQLFLNRGDGFFDEATPGPAFDDRLVARGAAYADLDRDGDLDVVLTENGGPVRLWRNGLDQPGRALRVVLEGRVANRDAVGAQVTAVVGERRMHRLVQTGSSFLSQSEMAVTFGLGDATGVDSLLVAWPGGTVDRIGPVEGGQAVRVVEGSAAAERLHALGPAL